MKLTHRIRSIAIPTAALALVLTGCATSPSDDNPPLPHETVAGQDEEVDLEEVANTLIPIDEHVNDPELDSSPLPQGLVVTVDKVISPDTVEVSVYQHFFYDGKGSIHDRRFEPHTDDERPVSLHMEPQYTIQAKFANAEPMTPGSCGYEESLEYLYSSLDANEDGTVHQDALSEDTYDGVRPEHVRELWFQEDIEAGTIAEDGVAYVRSLHGRSESEQIKDGYLRLSEKGLIELHVGTERMASLSDQEQAERYEYITYTLKQHYEDVGLWKTCWSDSLK